MMVKNAECTQGVLAQHVVPFLQQPAFILILS